MRKQAFEASKDDLVGEDSDKESSHNKNSDGKCKPKKDSSLSLM